MKIMIKRSAFILLLAIVSFGIFDANIRHSVENGIGTTVDRILPNQDEIPWEQSLAKRLSELNWQPGSNVFIRIFKQENKLELYGKHRGNWVLLKDYDICRWSGKLGPKFAEGDRQTPEGFYAIGKKQLNPHSRHHLSFNLGFPNKVEQAQGKTGSFLMIHGGCSSIGCYAITDAAIDEVYRIVEAALNGGQQSVPVHAFPFRMSESKLQNHKSNPAYQFWQELKIGYDRFETAKQVPDIYSCNARYGFRDRQGNPPRSCKPLLAW